MSVYEASSERYKQPDGWFRRCGQSGLHLPAISLGCWHNFGDAGRDSLRHSSEESMHQHCRQMLWTAFDHGITHFDLANNYGPPPGSAEARVGRILRSDFAQYRDELLISTKAGWDMWDGPYGNYGSRKHLLASLDQSLHRLQLDYVDFFYTHRPDPTGTPLGETLGALDTAVRSGKALYAGISMYDDAGTNDVIQTCQENGFVIPVIHQPNYSMLDRWIESNLLPSIEKIGMGVIVFCPLAQGLLTDKYLSSIPSGSRAGHVDGYLSEDTLTDTLRRTLNDLNQIAIQRGQSLAQMALNWVLRDERVTSALIGASRPEQIVHNVESFPLVPFDDSELADIDRVLDSSIS